MEDEVDIEEREAERTFINQIIPHHLAPNFFSE